MASPVDTMVHGALGEGLAQPNEAKRLGPKEEIQQRKFRLQEHGKERIWLREESAQVEVEVKKLEDEIKEDFLNKNTKLIKQGVHDHTDKFREYHHELISLMPWLGPYITTRIDQGGAL